MDRRLFLTLLATGAAAALAGCMPAGGATVSGTAAPGAPVTPVPATAALRPPPPAPARTAIPPGTITALPGPGTDLALPVDDGADPDVVGAYIRFARDSGARFTFFVTAADESWTIHRPVLRPLVESGQIQLANHTWDHPDLTTLSGSAVAEQLTRCQKFVRDNYGVDAAPYYRPPRTSRTPPSTRSRPTSDTPSPPSGTARCRIRRSSPTNTSSTAPRRYFTA